jgi:TetR/AcrR family transcriptional repressor of lmrAB and yxaGH operons
VTQAGRDAYAARLGILTAKLVADGFTPARAERLAGLCVSAIQGALIQARVERSGAPIEMAAEELARMLDELAVRSSPNAGAKAGPKTLIQSPPPPR